MLKNLKVGSRLGLVFSVLILLQVFVGGFAVLKMQELADLTTELHDHPFTVSHAVNDIKAQIYAMHRSMKDVALATDNKQIEAAVEEVNIREKIALDNFEVLEDRFLGDMEKITKLEESFLNWRLIRNEVITLSREGRKEEASTITRSKGATFVDNLEMELETVQEYADKKADEFMIHAKNNEKSAVLWVASFIVLSALIAVLAGIFVTVSITRPLAVATNIANQMSIGDMDMQIDIPESKDEPGQLLNSMSIMVSSMKKMATAANSVAEGDLMTSVTPMSEKDVLGNALTAMIESTNEMVNAAERISEGDLNVSVKPRSEKDVLGNALAAMVKNLREQARELRDGVNILASSSGQIVTTIAQLASSINETSSSASETTTTVEETRQTATVSSQKARSVSETAQNAAQISVTGRKATEETIEVMSKIKEQVELVAENIVTLSEQGQAIGEIIAAVDDLSEQTNLLAVNAAIEAVKAGEHGKGFSVVAQEVKTLAGESKQATKRVRVILNDIQRATGKAVMVTEEAGKTVDAGVKQASQAGEAITTLAESITEASQAATQIAASSQQQLAGMDQVASAMESIKEASAQNASGTKQLEVAAKNLNELGDNLKKLVAWYKFEA